MTRAQLEAQQLVAVKLGPTAAEDFSAEVWKLWGSTCRAWGNGSSRSSSRSSIVVVVVVAVFVVVVVVEALVLGLPVVVAVGVCSAGSNFSSAS